MSTHDHVLFFSTKGKVYRMKVHELPVGSRHARGTAVVNLLSPGDRALSISGGQFGERWANIGRAYGLQDEDNGVLHTSREVLTHRDRHRPELRPPRRPPP